MRVLKSNDPLKFKDTKKYKDRLSQAQKVSKESDALIVMQGTLSGRGIVVAAFDFGFMGGSMGSVVGERFVRGVNRSLELGIPFIVFTASGGARMQESLFSLFQMTKNQRGFNKIIRGWYSLYFLYDRPNDGGCFS